MEENEPIGPLGKCCVCGKIGITGNLCGDACLTTWLQVEGTPVEHPAAKRETKIKQ